MLHRHKRLLLQRSLRRRLNPRRLLFHLCAHSFFVHPRKERCRGANFHAASQSTERQRFVSIAKLRANFLRSLRHKWRQQRCTIPNGFQQIVHNAAQSPSALLAFRQYPWCCFVDIFIGSAKKLKQCGKGVRNPVGIHGGKNALFCCFAERPQRFIQGFLRSGRGNASIKILLCHRHAAADKIAKIVRKIRIIPRNNRTGRNGTVGIVWHFCKAIIPYSVYTKAIRQCIRIQHISFGFTHFVRTEQKPWMPENFFRQRFSERHKKNRPVNRVKAHDILPNHMHICRPILLIQCPLLIHIVAKCRGVIEKCIDPDINHVLFIKCNRYAPTKRRARNTKIL